MKIKIFIIALFLFGIYIGSAMADEQPPYLKDGKVNVRLKSGETYNFDSNEYKVVNRAAAEKFERLLAECREDSTNCKEHVQKLQAEIDELKRALAEKKSKQPEPKANRVGLWAGVGPDGLAVHGHSVEEKKKAPLIGVSLGRRVYQDWSLNALLSRGVSNESKTYTGYLGLGYDF